MAKTSRKSDAKRAKYGVWRWYKPAQLRTDNDELLPASSLPNILALTNFPDLKSLMAEINKHQAFEVPEPLQKRLRRLFDLGSFQMRLIAELASRLMMRHLKCHTHLRLIAKRRGPR